MADVHACMRDQCSPLAVNADHRVALLNTRRAKTIAVGDDVLRFSATSNVLERTATIHNALCCLIAETECRPVSASRCHAVMHQFPLNGVYTIHTVDSIQRQQCRNS